MSYYDAFKYKMISLAFVGCFLYSVIAVPIIFALIHSDTWFMFVVSILALCILTYLTMYVVCVILSYFFHERFSIARNVLMKELKHHNDAVYMLRSMLFDVTTPPVLTHYTFLSQEDDVCPICLNTINHMAYTCPKCKNHTHMSCMITMLNASREAPWLRACPFCRHEVYC
jgi:hypothetical protein